MKAEDLLAIDVYMADEAMEPFVFAVANAKVGRVRAGGPQFGKRAIPGEGPRPEGPPWGDEGPLGRDPPGPLPGAMRVCHMLRGAPPCLAGLHRAPLFSIE